VLIISPTFAMMLPRSHGQSEKLVHTQHRGPSWYQKKRFTRELKVETVKLITNADNSVSQVVEDFGIRPNMLYSISDDTFYTCRKKYGGMDISDAKRLKQLEDENRKFKQMLAEALLDSNILKTSFQKSGNTRCTTSRCGVHASVLLHQ